MSTNSDFLIPMCRIIPRFLVHLLLATIILAGCVTGINPDTSRPVVIHLPPAKEREIGDFLHTLFLRRMPIARKADQSARVTKIGTRLTQGLSAPHANWRFMVIESDEINAFTLPGGVIGVYTGLLQSLKDDSQLAAVLSHEVAHSMLRHPAETITPNYIAWRIGQKITAPAMSLDPFSAISQEQIRENEMAMLLSGVNVFEVFELPTSRKREHEADVEGMRLMARAGFDPKACISFWQQMSEIEILAGQSKPSFLSSHPGGKTRLSFLTSKLPEAEAIYQASR